MHVIGDGTPWEPFFQGIEPGTDVCVQLVRGLGRVDGAYDGTASWTDRPETVEYHGLVVATNEGIHTWIPYDLIVGVELP